MARTSSSPYRYDRAAIRLVLETQGLDAARAHWPKDAVDPIARVMGLTQPYRGKNEWNPDWTPLLGTKPDSVLAGELGIPSTTVSKQRQKLGIPTCDAQAWRDQRRALLASIPDDELAGSLDAILARMPDSGVTVFHLMAERRRRSVAARSNRGGKRAGVVDDGDLRRVAVLAMRAAFPDVTLERMASVLGCTRERVRQILLVEGQSVMGEQSTGTR